VSLVQILTRARSTNNKRTSIANQGKGIFIGGGVEGNSAQNILTNQRCGEKPEAAWGDQAASFFVLVDAGYDRVITVFADERLLERTQEAMMRVLGEGERLENWETSILSRLQGFMGN